MRRRTGRRGRKVVLEYSVLGRGRRGSFSLFPCLRICAGGLCACMDGCLVAVSISPVGSESNDLIALNSTWHAKSFCPNQP